MDKFQIDRCRQWIEENHFRIVALQVPDDDLELIQDLIDQLSSNQTEVEFYVVGDGCSSCCNDLINAQYAQAEALIHFGHSCLSTYQDENSPKISIFYVFYQQSLPEEAMVALSKERQETDAKYSLVFYDPSYRDAIEQFVSSAPKHLIFSKIQPSESLTSSSLLLYGRSIDKLPVPLDPSTYSIIFISQTSASRNNFQLYFYAYSFVAYPSTPLSTQRLLSKRMYAIECARNGSSFGLLLSSNSLLNLPNTIHQLLDHMKKLLNRQNRSYYTFLMNTVSLSKLNNFEQNIDTYVLCLSCPESSWLSPEFKQFNIPLISIMDLIQALEKPDEPSMSYYSFDLREILSKIEPINETKEISMNEGQAIVLKHPNALLLQQKETNERGRSYWGLEMVNVDEKDTLPIAELKEGKFGIASGYQHEKS